MAKPSEKTNEDSVKEAHEAGLHYATDQQKGIHRKAFRSSFRYADANGRVIKDRATLERIRKLVIPPAWTDVWICTSANGYLQATGHDARGRKQYRYHERWRQQRDETKFHRMLNFAKALPAIRRRLKLDLKRDGMPKEKVLATVVRLLETSLIRVGNDEYARDNHSYGLTTMRNRHAKVSGANIRFHFRGKSGKEHEISVWDPTLAKIVHRCQDLPGQELFTYEDEEKMPHDVTSQDVNDYLREIAQEDYTAKDFRTWAGTTLAALALQSLAPVTHETQARKNVKEAVTSVAALLGNTPTVCRKCYIHPAVVDAYLAGMILTISRPRTVARMTAGLKPEERAVLSLLRRWLKQSRHS
jgi:DNA topoisomerase-1